MSVESTSNADLETSGNQPPTINTQSKNAAQLQNEQPPQPSAVTAQNKDAIVNIPIEATTPVSASLNIVHKAKEPGSTDDGSKDGPQIEHPIGLQDDITEINDSVATNGNNHKSNDKVRTDDEDADDATSKRNRGRGRGRTTRGSTGGRGRGRGSKPTEVSSPTTTTAAVTTKKRKRRSLPKTSNNSGGQDVTELSEASDDETTTTNKKAPNRRQSRRRSSSGSTAKKSTRKARKAAASSDSSDSSDSSASDKSSDDNDSGSDTADGEYAEVGAKSDPKDADYDFRSDSDVEYVDRANSDDVNDADFQVTSKKADSAARKPARRKRKSDATADTATRRRPVPYHREVETPSAPPPKRRKRDEDELAIIERYQAEYETNLHTQLQQLTAQDNNSDSTAEEAAALQQQMIFFVNNNLIQHVNTQYFATVRSLLGTSGIHLTQSATAPSSRTRRESGQQPLLVFSDVEEFNKQFSRESLAKLQNELAAVLTSPTSAVVPNSAAVFLKHNPDIQKQCAEVVKSDLFVQFLAWQRANQILNRNPLLKSLSRPAVVSATTIAILEGPTFKFEMTTHCITIGRRPPLPTQLQFDCDSNSTLSIEDWFDFDNTTSTSTTTTTTTAATTPHRSKKAAAAAIAAALRTVSKTHCSICYDSSSAVFRLLNYSKNGTLLDGALVMNEVATLRSGCVIELGGSLSEPLVKLKFRIPRP